MTPASKFTIIVVVVAGTFGLLLGWRTQANAKLRTDIARQSAADASRIAELEGMITDEAQRVTTAEAKVTALLDSATQTVSTFAAVATARTNGPVDAHEAVKAALARGRQLIGERKPREALDVYLQCYQELETVQLGRGGRQSLAGAINHLARTFPEARTALLALRDAALAKWRARPEWTELVLEVAHLNRTLGDTQGTLALFDALPAGDRNRLALSMFAQTSFIESRRYVDALLGRSFGPMLSALEGGSKAITKREASQQASMRKSLIKSTATDIETLTGAGKLEEARVLTDKLLAFDNSESARAVLQQHLNRARRAQ